MSTTPNRPLVIVAGSQGEQTDRSASEARREFLELARRRFKLAAEAEMQIRAEALENIKFYDGDQWPQVIKTERETDGRPYLTINLLPESVSIVLNQQRQGRPQIQINPRGEGATADTAQVFQGLTRHIEVLSQAEVAYDWAFQSAVIGGFAYFRVLTEFPDHNTLDQTSFDQEIRIARVVDPFCIYYDPTCELPDYSDGKWCFIVQDLTREEFKHRYPKSEVVGLSDFRSIGDSERDWFNDGNIRVAEYYWVEEKTRTLVLLTNGKAVYEDELPETAEIAHKAGRPITRDVAIRTVRWTTLNARELLDGSQEEPFGTEWAGSYLPVIPVLGEELIVDGKRKLHGMVHWAKDAQRQYNYMRTSLVETIALAPKAPFVAEEGQIEGHEQEWKTANTKPKGVLVYKGTSVGGQPLPPPQRQFAEPPVQAIAAAVAEAANDFKSTTRIHEPMLGTMGPEQSGIAIRSRQNQGNLASFGYVDNLSRAILHLGRVLVDLMPKIYDRKGRVSRIVNPDQTHKLVTLNQQYNDAAGIERFYDLSAGKYDVTVSVGPGYESKRQEFVASVLQLVQSAPQIAQFVLDLVVRHMDWPGANEIADRLKKMLPPQLQDNENGAGGPPIPPEFQAKMEQLLQQQAMLTEQLNKATSIIQTKQMEIESRERIAAIQEQTKLLVAELKAQSTESIKLLDTQVAELNRRLDLLHENQPVEAETAGAGPQQAQPAGPQGQPGGGPPPQIQPPATPGPVAEEPPAQLPQAA